VERPVARMTRLRDAVRRALATDPKPRHINIDSSVDRSPLRLIPAPIRRIELRVMYVCQKEACQVQSAPPDIDTGSSVGAAFPVKVIFPDFLTYPAVWQHESDAQAVVHRQSCTGNRSQAVVHRQSFTGLFPPFLSCSDYRYETERSCPMCLGLTVRYASTEQTQFTK